MSVQDIKLQFRTASGTLVRSPATIEVTDGRIFFLKSAFALKDEIKAMKGSKWHGFQEENPRKIWSVEDCFRNQFQLNYLMGEDVYKWFDRDLILHEYRDYFLDGKLTSPMPHQFDMANSGLTYHYQIWGAEMGVGKTLSAQMVIENSGVQHWYWIGPKTSLPNIQREFRKWGFDETTATIEHMTYERLVRTIDDWVPGNPIPQGVIADESSKCKTDTSQRSKGMQKLADMIRDEYGWEGYVILMSGTPSPKKPTDWWSQCLSAETWTLTENGPRQISQLGDQPLTVRVRDTLCHTSGFYCTGNKILYTLDTYEGYSVKATGNHRFLKKDGSWCELRQLQTGDQIELANHGDANWEGDCTFGDGHLLGVLFGDGSLYYKSGGLHATLPLYGRKKELANLLVSYLPEPYVPTGEEPLRIHHKYMSRLARRFGFQPCKDIPAQFESSISSECMRGFLRGLFDTDGSIDYNRLRVTLSQVDKERVLVVQRMLSYFGIRSQLQTKKGNGNESYIEDRLIQAPEWTYILHITGNNAEAFSERIGFSHPDKVETLARRIRARHHHPTPTWATVKSLDEAEVEATYDIEVPGQHCFPANGLLAHNCEIAWPGFLREGSVKALKSRLAFQEQQTFDSGTFWKTTGWKDNELKCNKCGLAHEEGVHEIDPYGDSEDYHPYEASKNEVGYMFERLKGLVVVKHKKDCLDLPDKRYRKVICKPSASLLRVAKVIAESAPNAMTGGTLLRELSDGFQYRDIADGMRKCNHCENACGEVDEWFDPNDELKVYQDISMLLDDRVVQLEKRRVPCPKCKGKGEMKKIKRIAREIACPKEKALRGLLEECVETGRILIFAGFTGSVDRCVNICHKEGWAVVRCDGRGFQVTDKDGNILTETEALDFWADLENNPEVAFVAHPESGGMSLTLVESRMAVYWSNSFKPEYRGQSEDRIHRKGMDENLGCIIVDLIHLPTDERVLKIIRENRKLELLTLGELVDDIDWENAGEGMEVVEA